MRPLVLLLLAGCSGAVQSPGNWTDLEDARAVTLRLSWPGAETRAGCSAVAVAERRFLTVAHCRRGQWQYLTRERWQAFKGPQLATLVGCGDPVAFPFRDYVDGWCEYETEADLPAWVTPAGSCGDWSVVSVGMGGGYDWRAATVTVARVDRAWFLADTNWSGGDSGGPLVCGDRVVGLAVLAPGYALALGEYDG